MNIKRVIIALILATIISLFTFNFILSPSKASDIDYSWWNSNWHCRKLLKLSSGLNASSPQYPQGRASYQLDIVVVKDDGYDGGYINLYNRNITVVDCEGNCKDNFSDIRFLDRNNNPISYCIENIYNDSGLLFAHFVVRIPYSTYVNKTTGYIWMYYGYEGSIATTSNPYNTYFIYEDFEDGDIFDDYNWQTGGDGTFVPSNDKTFLYPNVTGNIFAEINCSSSSVLNFQLWIDMSEYVDALYYPTAIPVNVSIWASARTDPNGGSYLSIVTAGEDYTLKGFAENVVVWEKIYLYSPVASDLTISFVYNPSLSSYSWEAGAIDNIVVRSNFTPAPRISYINLPETNVISYTVSPSNNSTDVPVTNWGVLTYVTVSNSEGHLTNIGFFVANYSRNDWDNYAWFNNTANGTYSAFIPPEYCNYSMIQWRVILYDTQYHIAIYSPVYKFYTLAPSIKDEYPLNGSANVTLYNGHVNLTINATSGGENLTISWYYWDWATSNYTLLTTLSNVAPGIYTANFSNFTRGYNTYYWYVNVTGTVSQITNMSNLFNFTLKAPQIVGVSPVSGATNVTVDISNDGVNTSVNVSSYENYDIYFYYYQWNETGEGGTWIEYASYTNLSTPNISAYYPLSYIHDTGYIYHVWMVKIYGNESGVLTMSRPYNFTLKLPSILAVYPPSGSENISYNSSGVNTSVNVSFYENLNITWYYFEWNVTVNITEEWNETLGTNVTIKKINITGGKWVEYGNVSNFTEGIAYKFYPYSYINSSEILYHVWKVKVTGYYTNLSSYYVANFTVESPKILNPIPANGATNVSFSSNGINTSVQINSTSKIDLLFYWYDWETSSWKKYGEIDNISGTGRYGVWNSNFTGGYMRYYWNVTVRVNGTCDILHYAIFNFTTTGSDVLNVTLIKPVGTVAVEAGGVNTSIYVSHIAHQNINITWYWFNYTGDITNLSQWSVYAKDINVSSNATYWHKNANFTVGNMNFTWTVLVEEVDGNTYLFRQFFFNTSDAITISNPVPANNSQNVSLTNNGVLTSITVSHSLGHYMDLEWYYSRWVKDESGNWTANWTKYGETHHVLNGTYSKYLPVPAGITTYYWYVVARENISFLNQSYIGYSFSDVYKFTVKYESLNITMSPAYNSTVDAEYDGVLTSVYIGFIVNGSVDIYWYYYDWWNVTEIPSVISENDTHWKLYGKNLSVPLNNTYSQWLSVAKIGGVPFYWMVKIYPINKSDFNFTEISMFYCNRTFTITNVNPPSGSTGVSFTDGVNTSITISTISPLDIEWNFYDFNSSNWSKYANDVRVGSGTYYHTCYNFTYGYSKYYWMVNITDSNLPDCFKGDIYYLFVYNFSMYYFNFSNPIPPQNATSVEIVDGKVKTSITINTDCALFDIYWYYYDYANNSWIQYGFNGSVSAGTYSQYLPARRAGWLYAWRVMLCER